MLVADTEVLFALNPRDRKHQYAMKMLRELTGIVMSDVVALEFCV